MHQSSSLAVAYNSETIGVPTRHSRYGKINCEPVRRFRPRNVRDARTTPEFYTIPSGMYFIQERVAEYAVFELLNSDFRLVF